MTANLIAFLRARLDEDERIARAPTPGHEIWAATETESVAGPAVYDDQWRLVSGPMYDHNNPLSNRDGATGPAYINDDALMEHIARHDPARVLREVEAKRRIVAMYERGMGYDQALTDSLRLLALPYADHPDCRAEWRP